MMIITSKKYLPSSDVFLVRWTSPVRTEYQHKYTYCMSYYNEDINIQHLTGLEAREKSFSIDIE